MSDLIPLHVTVPKTARYYMIGAPSAMVRDVWVVCHGYAQLAATFAEPFRRLEHESRLIVVPEALSRFYFDVKPPHTTATPVGATWMTREDRDVEINDIISYLDTLTERLFESLSTHGVLREQVQVHALGFSQGGATVCRWASRGTARVGHLIVWGSGLPQDVNIRSINERAGAFRMDLVYGHADQHVTPGGVVAEKAILDGAGVPYRVRTFDGGHTLNGAVLRELFDEG